MNDLEIKAIQQENLHLIEVIKEQKKIIDDRKNPLIDYHATVEIAMNTLLAEMDERNCYIWALHKEIDMLWSVIERDKLRTSPRLINIRNKRKAKK